MIKKIIKKVKRLWDLLTGKAVDDLIVKLTDGYLKYKLMTANLMIENVGLSEKYAWCNKEMLKMERQIKRLKAANKRLVEKI